MKAMKFILETLACCALGAAFVGAAILLATFTHSY
jgi:hypothetical protein